MNILQFNEKLSNYNFTQSEASEIDEVKKYYN
jgi:hypothetical protein